MNLLFAVAFCVLLTDSAFGVNTILKTIDVDPPPNHGTLFIKGRMDTFARYDRTSTFNSRIRSNTPPGDAKLMNIDFIVDPQSTMRCDVYSGSQYKLSSADFTFPTGSLEVEILRVDYRMITWDMNNSSDSDKDIRVGVNVYKEEEDSDNPNPFAYCYYRPVGASPFD